MTPLTGDSAADAYLARLVTRAREILGASLAGAYLLNSGARDDYLPGRSDLDVALIVSGPLSLATKRALVDGLGHRGLRCPAPRLELVVFLRDVVLDPGPRPPFEVNLNSGPSIADHITFDPAKEPWFWFTLDLAAAADAARVIDGPLPRDVFGPVPRAAVLEALRASEAWHATHDTTAPNRVLNACRAWCWVVTGRWESKTAAAKWAIEQGGDADLIEQALALRAGSRAEPLERHRVDAFIRSIGRED